MAMEKSFSRERHFRICVTFFPSRFCYHEKNSDF